MIQAITNNRGKVKINSTGTYQELLNELNAIRNFQDKLLIEYFEFLVKGKGDKNDI